jgi:thiol-disulfide isomerase/thioredoxin
MLVTLAAAALVLTNAPAKTQLDNFTAKINAADSLNVSYKVIEVAGATTDYVVNLAKPNKAHLETPGRIIIADGDKITYFDRKSNKFYKKTQTPELLKEAFDDMSLSVWLPFFDGKAFEGLNSIRDAGKQKIGGQDLSVVEVKADAKGETAMKFYLDAESMPKRVAFDIKGNSGTVSSILSTNKIDMSAGAGDLFAFAPPSGSTEISEADLVTNKWFHNFDEAQNAAKATGKLIMIDFMASWCGPCKMMDQQVFQSAGFKDKAVDFVLCKIDVDEQPALAQRFGITAMPTVKFVNEKGNVVHEFVGYGGPDQVYGDMQAALGKR